MKRLNNQFRVTRTGNNISIEYDKFSRKFKNQQQKLAIMYAIVQEAIQIYNSKQKIDSYI